MTSVHVGSTIKDVDWPSSGFHVEDPERTWSFRFSLDISPDAGFVEPGISFGFEHSARCGGSITLRTP